jgi:hypothetical protein
VIKKSDPGGNAGCARTIELDGELNRGFRSRAVDGCFAWHVTSQTDGPAFVKTAKWKLIGICFTGCVKSSHTEAPCDDAGEATLYLCAGSAIVDGGVADLLNKEGICFGSEFFG